MKTPTPGQFRKVAREVAREVDKLKRVPSWRRDREIEKLIFNGKKFQPPFSEAVDPQQEAAEADVERAHPGWRAIVRLPTFVRWISSQPMAVKRLAESQAPADAIRLIDLYKESNP